MTILIIDTNDLDFVNNAKDYNYIASLIFQQYEPGIHRIKAKNEVQ